MHMYHIIIFFQYLRIIHKHIISRVLEENSYEGTKSRASKNSLELNPNRRVIPKRRVDNPKDKDQQYPLPKKKHEKQKILTSRNNEGHQKKSQTDPPTSKRRPDERKKQLGGGQDPPEEKSSKRNKQREESRSSKSKTSGSGSGDKRRSSYSKSRKRSSSKSRTSRHKDIKKEGSQVKPKPIQSILKKKEVPPPAYFGGGAQSVASSSNSANNDDDKPPPNSSDDASISMASTKSASESTMHSAIRRGRYAAQTSPSANINTISDDDSSTIISVISAGSDYSSTSDDEPDSFQFDRNKCHFIRTSDLGLTQDTIFAEQFLDNPSSTIEAHYHHPTPAPPDDDKKSVIRSEMLLSDNHHSPPTRE